MGTFWLIIGMLIGAFLVVAQYVRFNVRVVQLERREEDDEEDFGEEEEPFFTEGEVAQLTAPHEEGSFLKPLILFVLVMIGAFAYTICNAQTAPAEDATELERLRDELAREREARQQAEADAAEALEIAREATARLEEADDDSFVPFLMGAPTQRVPHSSAVMYVDRLPPGMASEDVLTVSCNGTGSCRSWLLVMVGNEPASLSLNGQQPFPMRVNIDGVYTALSLLPPGSRGFIAGVEGETTVRIVVFEGSPTDANGLRFAGVKMESGPRLRLTGAYKTDAGFVRYGGAVDAVKAILLQSRPLVSGR